MTQLGFSLEIFPPKTSVDVTEIYNSFSSFALLSPDFISVTYGAGGSTKRLTKEISRDIQQNFNLASVAHLTCVGSSKENVKQILDEFSNEGISRILALRGDLPNSDEMNFGDFRYATDLIKFISENGNFEIYAACYPEGHNENRDFNKDIEIAKIKNDMGVHSFISQLFFENDDFLNMRDAMAQKGMDASILAGIMPLTNSKQVLRIVQLSGAKLPAKLTKLVAKYEHAPDSLFKAGLDFSVEQIEALKKSNVDGIHLYTMNNPKIASYIYNNIKFIK